MRRENLHTHTCYCDGTDTPRALIEQALSLGFETLGFSEHSYTSFDTDACISRENIPRYCAEIRALANEYAGKIKILLGIEQDFYADDPANGYDYVIGSVHYYRKGDFYIPIDRSPEDFSQNLIKYWHGDAYAMCRDYFSLVGRVIDQTGADIIGHFDLVTKFNEGGCFFDETDPRYRNAAIDAADTLLATGKLFEINTGAMARGYRTTAYPAAPLIEYIATRGGKFIVSSDCHAKAFLDFNFDFAYTKYGFCLTSFETGRNL